MTEKRNIWERLQGLWERLLGKNKIDKTIRVRITGNYVRKDLQEVINSFINVTGRELIDVKYVESSSNFRGENLYSALIIYRGGGVH